MTMSKTVIEWRGSRMEWGVELTPKEIRQVIDEIEAGYPTMLTKSKNVINYGHELAEGLVLFTTSTKPPEE